MIKDWILENIVTFITFLFGGTSLVGWIKEWKNRKELSKKLNIENDSSQIDVTMKMTALYDKFVIDTDSRYEEVRKEVDFLKKEVTQLRKSLQEETEKYLLLKQNYVSLKNNYEKLKLSYDKLKIDFDVIKNLENVSKTLNKTRRNNIRDKDNNSGKL